MSTNIPSHTDFRVWLQLELMERCRRNPRYSLRAFANLLELDPSSVSQMISGRRKASVKMTKKICEKLSAEPTLVENFVKNARVKRSKLGEYSADKKYSLLTLDSIEVISNWYYFAILELMNMTHFKSCPSWMAARTGISVPEVKIALERLMRLELVQEVDGKFTRTEKLLTTYSPGETSAARKELQKQVLKMALESIENDPIEERDMTNMTMSIDETKLPEARQLITKFRRDLCAYLETGERSRVYQLGIQLYPISKIETKDN